MHLTINMFIEGIQQGGSFNRNFNQCILKIKIQKKNCLVEFTIEILEIREI